MCTVVVAAACSSRAGAPQHVPSCPDNRTNSWDAMAVTTLNASVCNCPVHKPLQERQDINKQMTAAVTAVQPAARLPDCMDAEQAGGQDTASSRDHMLPTTESLESRQEQLEQQEALTNRLNLLLHKEVGCHIACRLLQLAHPLL